MNKTISIAIHGGAGTISRQQMSAEKEAQYIQALGKALQASYDILVAGGSSLDAVEKAVIILEDSPLFNAGRGSVFTHEGKHEMDASIMEGKGRMAGAAAAISNVKNPVKLARLIMEHSGHVLLIGDGAVQFAKKHGLPMEEDAYFYDQLRYQQWQEAKSTNSVQLDHSPLKENKFGTVGAVALDSAGNLAAATSTGGMTNKMFGRVGDSPIIGSGNYANNETCAISCTGSGEYFLRGVVAYDVSCLMEYKGLTLEAACEEVIQKRLLLLGGDGGLVAVDQLGNICMPFNTEGMYRACQSSIGHKSVAIYR